MRIYILAVVLFFGTNMAICSADGGTPGTGPSVQVCQPKVNQYLQIERELGQYAAQPTPITQDAFEYELACHGYPDFLNRDQGQEQQLTELYTSITHPIINLIDRLEMVAADFASNCSGYSPPGYGEPIVLNPKRVIQDASAALLRQVSEWSGRVHANASMGRMYVAARIMISTYVSLVNNGNYQPPSGESHYLENAWTDYARIEQDMVSRVEKHDLRYTPKVFRWLWSEAQTVGARGVNGGATAENPDGVLTRLFTFKLSGTNHLVINSTDSRTTEDAKLDSTLISYSSKGGMYGTEYSTGPLTISYVSGQMTVEDGGTAKFVSPASATGLLRFDIKSCEANPAIDLRIERFGAPNESWLMSAGGYTMPVSFNAFMHSLTASTLLHAGKATSGYFDKTAGYNVRVQLKNGEHMVGDETIQASGSEEGAEAQVQLNLKISHN